MSATHGMQAWSCTVRLLVEDERVLNAAVADLTALLSRVDLAASRFRSDSELSRANRRAGRPVPVSKLLVDLVAAALDAARDSDGAVDPTVGLAMAHIGYDRDISEVGAGTDTAAPRRLAAWRGVRLHRELGLLTVPAGTALDLGATAKAWTADHAAQTLARRYDTGVLVEVGGDLAVAGHRPGGWVVQVAEREGAAGQKVLLTSGGLTTSTTTVRAWPHAGRRMHHIVDPRTGAPADGPWRTVSVAADSALIANVASTAAIVLGGAAPEWLDAYGVAARLVAHDGTVSTRGGWPADERSNTSRGDDLITTEVAA